MVELQDIRVRFYNEFGSNWAVTLRAGKRGTNIRNNKSTHNVIKDYLVELSNKTDIDIYGIKYAVIINEDGVISESEIHVDRLYHRENICRHTINIYNNFTVKKEQFKEWHDKYSKNKFIKIGKEILR